MKKHRRDLEIMALARFCLFVPKKSANPLKFQFLVP